MDLKIGLPVELSFVTAGKDGVDVPERTGWDTAAKQTWDALTPSKQRGLAHFVGSPRQWRRATNRRWRPCLG